MIKLVLADMDNTLIPGGEQHVSYRAVKAIRDLLDLGVRFGPATGRDTFELDRMFFGARDCYQTGIVANGKRIYVDGEQRQYTLIDGDALRRLDSLLADIPNAFLTTLPAENPRGSEPYRCFGARDGDLAWFAQHVGFTGEPRDSMSDEPVIAATIACAGTQAQLDQLLAQARELAPCFDYVEPFEHWVDVLPAGLNKGSALHMLLDELGITSDEVLFFGDAENDLGIMGEVENSVAVANATPAVHAAAKWHIGASADDAVAQALEELADAIRENRTPSFMTAEGQIPAISPESEEDVSQDEEVTKDELFEAIRALVNRSRSI